MKIIDVGIFLFYFIKISFPIHFLFKWRQNLTASPWIYPNLRSSAKIECLLKKYFIINFIHFNTHNMLDSIYLYQSVSLSPSSQSCLHLPHSHTSSLPFHNISSSVPFTALDILRFLKPCTFTSSDMCCHAIMILTD